MLKIMYLAADLEVLCKHSLCTDKALDFEITDGRVVRAGVSVT